ncbi:MAG: serine/threonine protein kinase [Burkholderiales bacterium]|nr:serine/threonine protein kinase [Burkholderiales bacterium]
MENDKLGRYEIVAELGKGAMGTVYRAVDPQLGRAVAIKTINLSTDTDDMAEYEARFYQEARAAGGLNHPSIVTIYDIGRTGNIAYLAMELLEGKELRTLMMPGVPMAVSVAVDTAIQIAEGLAYAHRSGVVHRDIKPANIMILREGQVKITDFGIAHMRSAEVRTQTGVVLGSPKYMSPEQVLGKRAEPGSDIFSLGIILYEMLTGQAPFVGAEINAIMFQIVNLAPPAPSSVNPAAPEMLDFIVAKALAKSLDERYSNARQLADDLRECAAQIKTASNLSLSPAPLRQAELSKIDVFATTQLLAHSYPHARQGDGADEIIDPTANLGLSKVFDSAEATRKLAVQTGMAEDSWAHARTQSLQVNETGVHGSVIGGTLSHHVAPSFGARNDGWNARDRTVFTLGVGVATILAAAIVLL